MLSPSQPTAVLRLSRMAAVDPEQPSPPRRLVSAPPEAPPTATLEVSGGRVDGPLWLYRAVNYVQSRQVPPQFLRWVRRFHDYSRQKVQPEERMGLTVRDGTLDRAEEEVAANANDKAAVVYWIAGLDQVVFADRAVADAVTIMGQYKLLPYLCYMLSGIVCDLLMLLTDLVGHFGLGIQDATTCWVLSFGLSVVPRHSALKVMCFGQYVGGYYQSLLRMYMGMSASIALSTVANYGMTKWWGVPHYVAWVVTLIWTGVVNYFLLKRLWTFGGDKVAQSA